MIFISNSFIFKAKTLTSSRIYFTRVDEEEGKYACFLLNHVACKIGHFYKGRVDSISSNVAKLHG